MDKASARSASSASPGTRASSWRASSRATRGWRWRWRSATSGPGRTLGDHLPLPPPVALWSVRPQKDATAAAFAGLDIVFLCTPAEASMALAPVALEAGARVVDLSGAFRLAGE